MKLITPISVFFFLAVLLSCQGAKETNKEQVTVFCASGLTDLITGLKDSIELKDNVRIKLNLASSGTLARQLELGNPADIYISANKEWADYADSLQMFEKRAQLCQNKLVFISPAAAPDINIDYQSPEIPFFKGYLSMGDPAHVPAGIYARQALTSLLWWEGLKDRILPAKDVHSALLPLELGECELGIVYYSDALASKKVKVVKSLPDSIHDPIIFEALLIRNASASARRFYSMLTGPSLDEVWHKHGLKPIVNN